MKTSRLTKKVGGFNCSLVRSFQSKSQALAGLSMDLQYSLKCPRRRYWMDVWAGLGHEERIRTSAQRTFLSCARFQASSIGIHYVCVLHGRHPALHSASSLSIGANQSRYDGNSQVLAICRARWKRLGNVNGTMLLLRLVEFVRRIAKDLQNTATHTVIQDIRNSLNRLLAKEVWWR
ncbi:hypothetical protein M422DRAFT_253583 [Sphaerobolus stellatus SS14]|uniref:Uncharacterized protein n=1 Tax=Sphaerobolus stellatus (strain SS14) TaxID=990650 RepID=A0A0C9VMK1_SPHS4|nr:hypothetical protein M422DRAFT_253583 [Sphaerobolus stellatus SS14]